MLNRRDILALAAISVGAASPAWAQRARGGAARTQPRPQRSDKEQKTPIEEFETLSPEEQQKALSRLSPSEREKLQERLKRFNALPAEQQQALKTLYNRLHQLPPARQDAVRKAINRFSEESPSAQEAIRQDLRGMAALPAGDRRSHLASPEFRARFSKKQQEIVRDMSELLPARQ